MRNKSRARQCALCAHPRRAEVDRFMAHGLSFKEFRAKFRFRKISIYTWSRHKSHLAMAVQTDLQAPAGAALSTGLDVQTLRGINRKLKSLAARAEKSGRMAHAIGAYSAMGRHVELMQRLGAEVQASDAPPSPETMTVEQLEGRIIELFKSEGVCEWIKLMLCRAGHREVLGRVEDFSTDELVKQIIGNRELRERLMDAVVQAQDGCEARRATEGREA